MQNKEIMWIIDWLSREEKIKSIYEIIADRYIVHKEWCQAFSNDCWKKTESWKYICSYCQRWWWQEREEEKYKSVLLWNVIQYANIVVSENSEEEDYTDEIEQVEKDILWYYMFYTKPIEEQTDDCIDYVYSLLKTNQPITS